MEVIRGDNIVGALGWVEEILTSGLTVIVPTLFLFLTKEKSEQSVEEITKNGEVPSFLKLTIESEGAGRDDGVICNMITCLVSGSNKDGFSGGMIFPMIVEEIDGFVRRFDDCGYFRVCFGYVNESGEQQVARSMFVGEEIEMAEPAKVC